MTNWQNRHRLHVEQVEKNTDSKLNSRFLSNFARKRYREMKHRISLLALFTFLFLLILVPSKLRAQGLRNAARVEKTETKNALLQGYEDSLRVCYDRIYRSTSQAQSFAAHSSTLSYQSYKLFAPLTFYRDLIDQKLRLAPADKLWTGADLVAGSLTDDAILNLYLRRPDLVQNSDDQLQRAVPKVNAHPVVIKSDLGLNQKVVEKPTDPGNIAVDVVVVKPNFWSFKGDYYLQFLQNYVSGNWYKGGESNYSMVGAVTLQLNYNNKQKVKWDNKLELKLGFVTSKSDSLHNLKTSEDLIRYTGKLGLQASKRWYYTMQLVAYTQFLRGYSNNSRQVFSDFMSPLNTNLSLGMDYNVNGLKGRLTGSIHLAPLAYNFRYVDRLSVASRYGLKPDRHTLHDFGSEFTFDLLWKMSESVSWQTRLYGYTTYRRAEVEWENTFTFRFNKYISSKLFLYPRFDDGTARDGHHGYWQLREFASIGFSYGF